MGRGREPRTRFRKRQQLLVGLQSKSRILSLFSKLSSSEVGGETTEGAILPGDRCYLCRDRSWPSLAWGRRRASVAGDERESRSSYVLDVCVLLVALLLAVTHLPQSTGLNRNRSTDHTQDCRPSSCQGHAHAHLRPISSLKVPRTDKRNLFPLN